MESTKLNGTCIICETADRLKIKQLPHQRSFIITCGKCKSTFEGQSGTTRKDLVFAATVQES